MIQVSCSKAFMSDCTITRRRRQTCSFSMSCTNERVLVVRQGQIGMAPLLGREPWRSCTRKLPERTTSETLSTSCSITKSSQPSPQLSLILRLALPHHNREESLFPELCEDSAVAGSINREFVEPERSVALGDCRFGTARM